MFKRKELSKLKSTSILVADVQPIYVNEYKEAWQKLKEQLIKEDNKDLIKAMGEIEAEIYKQSIEYINTDKELKNDELKKIEDAFFKRYSK
ncbi:hypothetical protein [Clostridium akagii]|uniref:hypothetical protein n=1 Tax=Clostridium akagii TaxID=91623 RepID=UPI00047CED9C|nr:hypothetical protein [Clostridium akagii]